MTLSTREKVLLGVGVGVAGFGLYILSRRRSQSGQPKALFAFPSYATKVKITNAPTGSDGYVHASPSTLAAQAGMGLEPYTLARAVASEYASGNAIEKDSIGWAFLNEARRRGKSLTALATLTSKYGQTNLYGSQEHGRFISTARDPTKQDAYVADMILSSAWPDPTGGATKFFDPATQDAMHAKWVRGETSTRYRSANEIIAKWSADGYRPVTVPGTDASELILFVPV